MNPNRLAVLAVLLVAPASAETFADWALISAEHEVFGARKDLFTAAYERHDSGEAKEQTHLPLYELKATDADPPDSVMAVAAVPYGCLRLYPKNVAGVPMAMRLTDAEPGDISARLLRRPGDDRPYGNGSGRGLKSFRGGWERPIKVTVTGEVPGFCAGLMLVDSMTPVERTLAEALRELDATAYAALLKAEPAGRGPLFDAVKKHLSHEPTLTLTDGKPDLWASLHPIDRAALARLPADQRQALQQKLAGVSDEASARAVLGEIRKAVNAFIASGGDPGAMAALQAASRRVAAAKLDPETGAITFDGAAPSDAAAVVTAGPGGDPLPPPDSLYTGDPGRQGVVTSPLTAAPPKPVGSPMDGKSGGLLGKAGDLLKKPVVAVAGGALAGAMLGFMLGGPFGAVLGATFGMMGGLLASQTFGGGPRIES